MGHANFLYFAQGKSKCQICSIHFDLFFLYLTGGKSNITYTLMKMNLRWSSCLSVRTSRIGEFLRSLTASFQDPWSWWACDIKSYVFKSVILFKPFLRLKGDCERRNNVLPKKSQSLERLSLWNRKIPNPYLRLGNSKWHAKLTLQPFTLPHVPQVQLKHTREQTHISLATPESQEARWPTAIKRLTASSALDRAMYLEQMSEYRKAKVSQVNTNIQL